MPEIVDGTVRLSVPDRSPHLHDLRPIGVDQELAVVVLVVLEREVRGFARSAKKRGDEPADQLR
jgi:hypothetical protein